MSDTQIKEPKPTLTALPEPSAPAKSGLATLSPLGRWLEKNRAPEQSRKWRTLLFGLLGLFMILNLFFHPHEPHFGVDAYPFFWPFFGLAWGIIMIFLVKKIIQPHFLARSEDYYGDN